MVVEFRVLRAGLQSALDLIVDRTCITCGTVVTESHGLCGTCWRDTPFISGLVCDKCGVGLPGEDTGQAEFCDDCLTIARPWNRGRAALSYSGNARRIVLALKHGDRLDLAKPAGLWMKRAAEPLLTDQTLVTAVPLSRMRLFRRRYNQSVELGRSMARLAGVAFSPDLLIRRHFSGSQDGRSRDGRFSNVVDAFAAHPSRGSQIGGRDVLLVDDVMTSGATFSAATEACHAAGARSVSVLALARVAKET